MSNLPTNADPELQEAWQDWLEYRAKEKREPVGPVAAKRQLRYLDKWGRDKFILAIERSINQNWMGLFEPEDYRVKSGTTPLWKQIQNLEQEIANHPANHESLAHDPNCPETVTNDLLSKRKSLYSLRQQQNGSNYPSSSGR